MSETPSSETPPREVLAIRPGLNLPLSELRFTFARSGGPGGQHVNKTSTKVVCRLDLTSSPSFTEKQKGRLSRKIPPRFLTSRGEVLVSSDRFRDQAGNRRDCLDKLGKILREALTRKKRRIPTKPSRAARERRIKQKKERGKRKKERGRKDFD